MRYVNPVWKVILFLVVVHLIGTISSAKPRQFEIDTFARGVVRGDPAATLDRCITSWLSNTPPLPYKWEEWGCDDLVGYEFTLEYTDKEGKSSITNRVVGEKTDRTTELDQAAYKDAFTEEDEWGEKYDYSENYLVIVKGYLRCAKPDFIVSAEETHIDVGDETRISIHLICDGLVMGGEEILLSLNGPGELSNSNLTTDGSGMAETMYRGTENGLAVIIATWIPELKKCKRVSENTVVFVGIAPVTATLKNKISSDRHEELHIPYEDKENQIERNFELTVLMTFEKKPLHILPEGNNLLSCIYNLDSFSITSQDLYREEKGSHEKTAPSFGKVYEKHWDGNKKGTVVNIIPLSKKLEILIDKHTKKIVEVEKLPAFDVIISWEGRYECWAWEIKEGKWDCSTSLDSEETRYLGETLDNVEITHEQDYIIKGYKKKVKQHENGRKEEILEWKVFAFH